MSELAVSYLNIEFAGGPPSRPLWYSGHVVVGVITD